MRVAQGDVQGVLAPGEGILIDAVRAMDSRCVVQSDTWVVHAPDAALRELRPRADKTATLLRREASLTRMMMGVIEAYHRLGDLATPDIGASTAQYLADLMTLALGADADGTHVAEGRGLKAARLQAVLDDIARHYTDAAIDAAAVARRVGVTPRYVHLLLEETGRTFSDHVLDRRLTLARRLVLDPEGGRRRIADVAFDCGFNDLSYFNRTFRRRFGMTPSDLRAGAPETPQHGTDAGLARKERRR
jgi:AraC-like DNA-binding protein